MQVFEVPAHHILAFNGPLRYGISPSTAVDCIVGAQRRERETLAVIECSRCRELANKVLDSRAILFPLSVYQKQFYPESIQSCPTGFFLIPILLLPWATSLRLWARP